MNARTAHHKPVTRRSFRDVLVWPGIIFGLISISMTLMTITFVLAITDSSFGLEEDYYAKAVAWDDTSSILARSNSLGWSAAITISDSLDERGNRGVMIVLTDSQGDNVDASLVEAMTFHHARRTETLAPTFARIGPGRFSAGAPLTRPGIWQFRLRFEKGSEVFLVKSDVVAGSPPERGQ
ncbi:MAG: FixH family protein [Planctomycetota bacterium]